MAENDNDRNRESWARWKRRVLLLAIFFGGVFFIAWSPNWPWNWAHETIVEVIKEIGIAFVIAATIGATIDSAFKVELVRDAFFAAFAYAFPRALQGEILRIMRYKLVCEEHFLRVSIEKVDNEAVRVTSEVKRKIRNIGSSSDKLRPYLHIDEWGFKQEESKILVCKIEPEKGKPSVAVQQTTDWPTILFSGKEVNVQPNKYVTLTYKWSELRRHNDSIYVNFSYPTVNPEIDVPPVPGFKTSRSFGSASDEIDETISGRERVAGTYLPLHYMVVRWWPETEEERPSV
jgi:hypothetical protein